MQTSCQDSTSASATYDAGSEQTQTGGSTVTKSHVVANQSNRLLICSITREEFGTNRSISSVVFNTSETMTFAAGTTTPDVNNKVDVYYLLAPSVATADVVVTYSGGVGSTALACDTFYNIIQQAPEVTSTSAVFSTVSDGALVYSTGVGSISTTTLTGTGTSRHNFANTGISEQDSMALARSTDLSVLGNTASSEQ